MKLVSHVTYLLSSALAMAALGACQDSNCDVDSGDICTVVGTDDANFAEAPLSAVLYHPLDLTEGPDGNLYVADFANHRIRVITDNDGVWTVAGTGNTGEALPGDATRSDLYLPSSIVFDDRGRMVIAVWNSSKIVRVDLATGQLEHLYGTGDRDYIGDEGPASEAVFNRPAKLAYDASGNLYVADQYNQVIRKIDASGTVTRVAGQCVIEGITGCMPGEAPVACEGTDKVTCMADEDPESACLAFCSGGFTGDGGPALDARLALPVGAAMPPGGGMAFDAEGNLYVADTHNHRIRRIDTSGVITTVAGDGNRGFAGDGGPATDAQLASPSDIEIARDGTIYVADTDNSCVRAFQPGGVIRTVAGVCGQHGFDGDRGPATEALLDRPRGIELDREDNLYIADTHNHRIRFVPR